MSERERAIIKLIEKKDRDKMFIKNWRSVSLLNVDLKNIKSSLIFWEIERRSTRFNLFTANVKNRNIGESRRFISILIKIVKRKNIDAL